MDALQEAPMIETSGLTCTFGKGSNNVVAVAGVDLSVARGEIVGCVGANGAGKTTLQRMLSTLLSATAGSARVAGCDLRRDAPGVRRRIGYVSQAGGTNAAARVGDELILQARLHGLSRADAELRRSQMLETFHLTDLRQRVVKDLSGGQRRRLDIALGLIHAPAVVFLDEPTVGLDPGSRADLWNHVRALKQERGATIFLTTHYLEEADALCDRLLVMDRGSIVAQGTPAALKREVGGDVITICVEGAPERAEQVLRAQAGVRVVLIRSSELKVSVDCGKTRASALMRALDSAGFTVSAFHISGPTLEEAFSFVTGASLPPANAA